MATVHDGAIEHRLDQWPDPLRLDAAGFVINVLHTSERTSGASKALIPRHPCGAVEFGLAAGGQFRRLLRSRKSREVDIGPMMRLAATPMHAARISAWITRVVLHPNGLLVRSVGAVTADRNSAHRSLQVRGKGRRERRVFLTSTTAAWLEKLAGRARPGPGWPIPAVHFACPTHPPRPAWAQPI
ncbi:hypothetical protein HD597_000131 [Nonomuraea thailandensis]|uniref:Uncharacterized protein n=1 Tax=Nonomuraea thailandensis TaxID=1188745 RepID=A0A9X2K135_9ACTN|nr:hypothetical protein [Nonomuraea thailandensis]MCP2353111.1 hypothetical protein [Nonomuraea thailandensis]